MLPIYDTIQLAEQHSKMRLKFCYPSSRGPLVSVASSSSESSLPEDSKGSGAETPVRFPLSLKLIGPSSMTWGMWRLEQQEPYRHLWGNSHVPAWVPTCLSISSKSETSSSPSSTTTWYFSSFLLYLSFLARFNKRLYENTLLTFNMIWSIFWNLKWTSWVNSRNQVSSPVAHCLTSCNRRWPTWCTTWDVSGAKGTPRRWKRV